jgi:excisionase family DNA binding protein
MKIKALYSIPEAARLLGRPRRTVFRWAERGLLTTVEVAGDRFVPLAALQVNGLVWDSVKLAARLAKAAV